jgi:hypothetical protein
MTGDTVPNLTHSPLTARLSYESDHDDIVYMLA